MNNMETTFTQYVNNKIKLQFSQYEHSVIYGQNIVAGSRISGLGSQLEEIKGVTTINSTNSENSLMGLGLGLAISNIPSMFMMKQHDFALLGIDQLTNTTNVLRKDRFLAPLIILMVVVDSGYEGPQASLSSLDEFASLVRAPVHFLSTIENIDLAFENAESPGLHFMALSQKNMKKSVSNSLKVSSFFEEAILYKEEESKNKQSKTCLVFYGVEISFIEEVVIRSKIVDISYDIILISKLSRIEKESKLFSQLSSYEKIIIIDTGKSEIHFSSELAWQLKMNGKNVFKFQRKSSDNWSKVTADELEFKVEEVVSFAQKGTID
jgi:pyruvate/2-oxoglutarate/acetoin dehydrogenase E1 component